MLHCTVPWRRLGHTPRSREGLEAAATAARRPTGIGPGVVLNGEEDAHNSMMEASCTVIELCGPPTHQVPLWATCPGAWVSRPVPA